MNLFGDTSYSFILPTAQPATAPIPTTNPARLRALCKSIRRPQEARVDTDVISRLYCFNIFITKVPFQKADYVLKLDVKRSSSATHNLRTILGYK